MMAKTILNIVSQEITLEIPQASTFASGAKGDKGEDGSLIQVKVNGSNLSTPADITSLNFSGDGVSGNDNSGAVSVEFVYSGLYKGEWDMSSGTSGPAVAVQDFNCTHTATTFTPSNSLSGTGPVYLAATSSSGQIEKTTVGTTRSASLTCPAYNVSDTIGIVGLLVCNSAVTAEDLLAIFTSATPTNAVWFTGFTRSQADGTVILSQCDNNVATGIDSLSSVTGDKVIVNVAPNGDTSLTIGTSTISGASLNIGSIPAGQYLKLFTFAISSSATTVFQAGSVTFNFSETSSGRTGFIDKVNAPIPAGTLDNDWFYVPKNKGGYFNGITTRGDEYVKLISQKTKLIIIPQPKDQQSYPTYIQSTTPTDTGAWAWWELSDDNTAVVGFAINLPG